jgi:RimJ/RimL family protein N-acetyltransferase
VLLDPTVWPYVSDDTELPDNLADLPVPAGWIYLNVIDQGGSVGFFAFARRNAATWDLHYALLPAARGARKSDAIFQAALRWLWANTKCQRLMGEIPVYNRVAIAYAKRNGMIPIGINSRSWLKNGQLHDTELFGLSRNT